MERLILWKLNCTCKMQNKKELFEKLKIMKIVCLISMFDLFSLRVNACHNISTSPNSFLNYYYVFRTIKHFETI